MPMKILIVEDHPSVALVLQNIIREIAENATIESHTNLSDGLANVRSGWPNLVISDIQIGNHKQLDILMECFEQKTPCMVFSSYINQTILGHCDEYRATVVVAKSSPITELKQGLEALITGHSYRCSACIALSKVHNPLSEDTPKVIFTHAEEFVILAQIAGKSTIQLAEETKKSKYTIRNQRMSLIEKNGCTMEEIVRRYLFWHTNG
jgi:DNA-binding NarL/FixJ family response regulator